MVKIQVKENSLVIENYNINCNLSWLDVADALELQGIYIRIDNSLNVPILIYKKQKYLVTDSHIEQLETANRVVFQKL